MKPIIKIALKDKEITDAKLIGFITSCLVETGGIQHVDRNLAEMGYPDFTNRAYSQLDDSKKTQVLDFSDLSSNQFLVICMVIFVTIKDVEDDILIQLPFNEGIQMLRSI